MIHSLSRLNPPPAQPMSDGVEFYLTEFENELSSGPGLAVESYRACTVLVSFARGDSDRASIRPILSALAVGRTSSGVCSGPGWHEELASSLQSCLQARRHDLVTAVIYSGAADDSGAEAINAARGALRGFFGASLAAILVVTDPGPSRFESVQGVSAFVVGAQGGSAEAARSVFLCLAMLAAPTTMNGIDFEDLWPVFGSASAPTVLAHAVWLPGRAERLEFAAPADADAVRRASRLVAVPLVAGPWRMAELLSLMSAVRAQAASSDSCIFFAPYCAMAPECMPCDFSLVPILCHS